MEKRNTLKVIDLFAGIGGMRLGFEQAGYEVVYSNDIDPYACQTYRTNFGEIDERDVRQVDPMALPNVVAASLSVPRKHFQ